MVRQVLSFKQQALRPCLSLLEFHVVVLQEIYHDFLDFLCCEETTCRESADG
jgi:hypothetical protein